MRSYAAPAYYAPNAGNANFLVLTGAQATKINFSSTQNNGQYTEGDRPFWWGFQHSPTLGTVWHR
jgi:hypothetical protein